MSDGDFDNWLKGQEAKPAKTQPKTSPPSGGFDSWMKGESKPYPRNLLPTERQEFGRRSVSLDESLQQSARFNRGKPQPSTSPDTRSGPLYQSVRDMGRRAFESKPLSERAGERVYDAFARGGGTLSRMLRQPVELVTGPIEPWRKFERERNAELEQRRLARPTSIPTEIGEGIIEAAPVAAAGGLLSAAGGGGLLATGVSGAGLTAAGADWSDPARAATQTVLGAAAPIIGGRVGTRLGGVVADRLGRPALQAGARVGGELVGGGAGNVLGAGAEQLAFEGRLNPRELGKQAVIGSALNVPGAAAAGRRAPVAPKLLRSRTDEGAIIAQPSSQELVPESFGYISGRKLLPAARGEEILPTEPLPSRAVREVISQPDPRFVPPAPNTQRLIYPDAPETAEMPAIRITAENDPTADLPLLGQVNNPEGGVPPRSERLSGNFGRLARQQEAQAAAAPQPRRKDTGVLSPVEYLKRKTGGDGIRVSDRGEAALLGAKEAGIVGLTNRGSKWTLSDAQVMLEEGGFMLDDGRRFTDPSVTENDVLTFLGASGKEGRVNTRGLDQRLADEEAAYYAGLEQDAGPAAPPKRTPLPPPAPRRPGGRVGVPQPRRDALDDFSDFFGQMKAEEVSPRVPRATDENIEGLRNRREQLSRLEYDRRGDFTGDLRDEARELGSVIREYENARSPRELAPPREGIPERDMSAEEKQARRAALEPRTGPMPETLTPGRKVTQEVQIPPALKPTEAFSSREDARQGYFERFDDQELVEEIRRMEEVRSQGVRGKLTPEQVEANNFDLKVAVEMQKERLRQQTAIGVDPANRIAPRTPVRTFKKHPESRKIQHSTFGEVTQADNQKGVPAGKIRVVDAEGAEHMIQNPRTRGNREATFVRSTGAIPAEAMPEMKGKVEPPIKPGSRQSYAIPDEAMPELRGRKGGTILGAGLGGLQPMFEGQPKKGQQTLFGGDKPKNLSRKEIAETAGGVQTLSQLGNPRFVIRNVVQHVAFGKQERAATRLAAALDWAISKASGKPRQVFQPQGSDLKAYVQNWGKAVKAYKSGQPLPGKPNADYLTADANKLDRAVSKAMLWMNEIPDAANWQTRFEGALQTIMGDRKLKAPLDMDAVVDQAMMEANKASLRDENFVSNALLTIKQGLNKFSSPVFGTDKFGVGDFVLKYAQTPGAIFKRGLERSPLGLFQVAKEAATPGPFRRRNTLLALSRVAEGATTGAVLGAALAAAGVLVGPEEESRSGKAMEREEGVRGYSLNASALRRLLTGETTEMQEGDTLYSIDWLQPWAMNVSAGAAVWNLHENGKMGATAAAKTTGEAIYNSLAKTLDVMGDQSVLKNLSRYIDRASGETFADQFLNFVKAVGLDVPSSFVPSSVRQVRQVADPFERDTRAEQRGGFKRFVEEAGNRALSQIPGVSESFPKRPSLLTGEDRKTSLGELGVGSRVAAQFSPANVSTFTPRAVAQEISRLNRSGQKVSVSFPAPATDKKTGQREPTSSLRVRERRFAETFSKLSQEMIADQLYKDSDNETKAAAFEGLKRYIRGMDKEDAEEKGIDEIIEAAISTVEKRREKE